MSPGRQALPPGSTLVGTAVTLKQLVSGEMSMKQFRRYKQFFGLNAEDVAATSAVGPASIARFTS